MPRSQSARLRCSESALKLSARADVVVAAAVPLQVVVVQVLRRQVVDQPSA
jgi:hypothetical protein